MSQELLVKFQQHLSSFDFTTLKNVVYHLENKIKFDDKIIAIRGLPNSGKTSLIRALVNIVGEENSKYLSFYDDVTTDCQLIYSLNFNDYIDNDAIRKYQNKYNLIVEIEKDEIVDNDILKNIIFIDLLHQF
jgi:uridine kinase